MSLFWRVELKLGNVNPFLQKKDLKFILNEERKKVIDKKVEASRAEFSIT